MNKNDFAITPPMGWNSYDYYDTTVTEEQVKKNADFMAKNLKQFGWEYVVVDIEWYSNDAGTRRKEYQYIPFGDDEMDEYGRMIPSPNRFPSSKNGAGFKPLADYCHNLGLKFGIHIMRGIPRAAAEKHLPVYGTNTNAAEVADAMSICGWNPDMYGVKNTEGGQAYYNSIIKLYAEWGVDFIKCDDICDSWMYRGDNFNGWHETRMLHKAILENGRPIVLSLSPGPAHIDKAFHYCDNANMWRITDDFWDKWELLKNMFWRCEMWQDHVRRGCFPDCDMLPLGKVGAGFGESRDTNFTYDEEKTMMTLWCMFRSPLMIGAELTMLDDKTLKLLTNKKLLGLMKEGCKGRQLVRDDKHAIWINENANTGSTAVAVFNFEDNEKEMQIDLTAVSDKFVSDKKYELNEIWDDTCVTSEVKFSAKVPSHGVKVWIIK